MRIVLPGGSGQVGTLVARDLSLAGHRVTVLSRSPASPSGRPLPWRVVPWDGRTLGPWVAEFDGADAVLNLSGRTVNCRYTSEHRKEILESRTLTTELVGRAIAQCNEPPRTWLNASTATIYRDSQDRAMDEATGEILPVQPGVPETYNFSVGVGLAWEAALQQADTPHTRKVALRSAMVMSPDKCGVFDVLLSLVRRGLGGTQGSGRQYVSWIHDQDFCRAIRFLLENEALSGPVNLCAPHPLPNADFLAALRDANGTRWGLPASRALLEMGAVFLQTETELILKSRRAIPGVLQAAGFDFVFPDWPAAAKNLVRRSRALREAPA